jgi:hypothetical protein
LLAGPLLTLGKNDQGAERSSDQQDGREDEQEREGQRIHG